MRYTLRDGLSFCFVDGHPIFLDVSGDRYFMLPPDMAHGFTAYIEGREPTSAALHTLLERKILVPSERSGQTYQTASVKEATHSVAEEQARSERISARVYLEVLAIVFQIKRRLRKVGLHVLLNDLAAHRKRKAPPGEALCQERLEASIVVATNQFRNARKWIPFGTSCLLDSLSLATYLANRRLQADLVFGVALSPFAAHCWVQFHQNVLNETVTGAAAHTPILVW